MASRGAVAGGPERRRGKADFLKAALIGAVFGLLPVVFLLSIPLLPAKWFVFTVLLLCAGALVLAFSNNKLFHLGLLAFSLCLNFDIHIFTVQNVRYQSTYGYLIPLTLFPLVMLYARRIWENWARKGDHRLRMKRIVIPLVIYGLFCLVSLAQSADPEHTKFELFALAQSLLIYFYLSSNINSRKEIRVIIFALAAGIALQAVIASMQYATGSYLGLGIFGETERQFGAKLNLLSISRVSGTLGHPNTLARYLEMILPLMLAMALTYRSRFKRLLFTAITAMGSLALIFSLSRAGLMVTAAAMLVVLFVWGKRNRRLRLVVSIVLACAAVGLLIFTSVENPVRTRFIEHDYGAAYSRVPMVVVASKMIEDNLLLGVGLNTYVLNAPRYDYTTERISLDFAMPVHNMYLLMIAEIGIFGFLGFMVFVFILLAKGFAVARAPDQEFALVGLGLVMGILAYLVHTLVATNYVTKNFTFWLLAGTLIGLWNFLRQDTTQPNDDGRRV